MVFCGRRVERGNTYIVVILFQVMCNWAFGGPPVGPLGFLCCFLHSSVCLAFEKKILFHSAVLQCEEPGATVDVQVCVCAFVGETEPVCSDSITHAGSHCGTLT